MTDKELKRLKRVDLLELLIAQSRENERLQAELAEAQSKLEARELTMEQAGSIAEAALRLNKVFEAAQAAADQYILSVKAQAGKDPADAEEAEEAEKEPC